MIFLSELIDQPEHFVMKDQIVKMIVQKVFIDNKQVKLRQVVLLVHIINK